MEFIYIILFIGLIIGSIILFGVVTGNKRETAIKNLAEQRGWNFLDKQNSSIENYFQQFRLVKTLGKNLSMHNITKGRHDEFDFHVFDYLFEVGSGKKSKFVEITVSIFESLDPNLPEFRLRPKKLSESVLNTQGKFESSLKNFVTSGSYVHIESMAGYLLYVSSKRPIPVENIPAFIEKGANIAKALDTP